MELTPCCEQTRLQLADLLNKIKTPGESLEDVKKSTDYVIQTFPNILVDIVCLVINQATDKAKEYSSNCQAAEANIQQLKPFFVLGWLLGKSPQISSLIYNYFENSSFQPLPEESFQYTSTKQLEIAYTYPGFDDNLVKDILETYFKYLTFNPKWFAAVWNWSELARFISLHPNKDICYLAACCFSLITRPSRHQHMMLMQDLFSDPELLIEQQLKHAKIYRNKSRPLVETRTERASEFIKIYSQGNAEQYEFCSEAITRVANTLLPKRDLTRNTTHMKKTIEKTIAKYVPVAATCDAVSRVAYAASINKPCLIRGPTGSGKTSLLDYVAAHTNRVSPPDYIKVQVGDQIDSKSLVGSYVCTEIPGQFEWQAGPLTQAMAYGSWIVFEDIDSAPSEMAQVIHSVIQNGNLSCVSSCPIKIDNPHPDFKIFFTQRTRSASNRESLKLGFGFIETLCDIVDMPEFSDADLKEILKKRYQFGLFNDVILQIFETARNSMAKTNIAHSSRKITLRDLFKFCDRVSSKKMQMNEGKYLSSDLNRILMDAIDCFLASLPQEEISEPARALGQILNMPQIETDALLSRRPDARDEGSSFIVGRSKLDIYKNQETVIESKSILAPTRQSSQLLEAVSQCIQNREPILLVGETGVGKTSIVQHLAKSINIDLTVINLSQQSDSADLLGGFRPVEMRDLMRPISETFNDLFRQTYDVGQNDELLRKAEGKFISAKKASDWRTYVKLIVSLCARTLPKTNLAKDLLEKWAHLSSRARKMSKRLSEKDSSLMALTFVEGTLINAVRKGKWILLDEINLAEPDVLQCLLLILDSIKDTHLYMNCGNDKDGPIFVNPKFRIFACMNPSTDIGKRDLPIGIRGRFTEFFVDDVDDSHDIRLIVESYVKTCLKPPQIENIVNFYREIRFRSKVLNDVSGNSPVYSLRTLCRALVICSQNVCKNMEKSLLESIAITFLQQLNQASAKQVMSLIGHCLFKSNSIAKISEIEIPMPQDSHQYIQVERFWIQTSSQKKYSDESYILTKTVRENLSRICRILCLGRRKLPILIQGNTSVGKTSLIKYLARISGNHCFRINNHEHTDLQEYIGKFVLRENGELQFQDGLLVTAMKKGYWVILDELNLAPCELLEALNRVLDDNRELFIPETREYVRANSKFVLFATQNPPEEYAGRKPLSRAFRNRFIELHFDELPHKELEEILHQRCQMPPQYAGKVVAVMRELQLFRRESGCFGGKSSFMTMRDLFRWGQRYLIFKHTIMDNFYDWDMFMASQGLILLEGRVRTTNEAVIVKSIIEKIFKRKLDRNVIYDCEKDKSLFCDSQFKHIHFTPEFKRLYIQLSEALRYKEPVLLCGQTGCGKTTACQLYANETKSDLIIYNCHLNTESSDFVGNVRPCRDSTIGTDRFPWYDGPLVKAMKGGSIFLMDEISLADDAVLERINSVLEPDRSITLTERDGQEIVAKDTFRIVATMNPGGDYGKKELSPALRNRFTEIYCHNTSDIGQIVAIIEKSLSPAHLRPKIAPHLIKIMSEFLSNYYQGQDVISLRDVLSWTKFINKTTNISQPSPLTLQDAITSGAEMVFFDQFGTCGHKVAQTEASDNLRDEMLDKFRNSVKAKFGDKEIHKDKLTDSSQDKTDFVQFGKYYLRKGKARRSNVHDFVFIAPTVKSNTEKITRALQLDRPVLLEGDPGAGKTSVVTALARLTGHELVRINLSEQTDISDLFGSDLPDLSNSTEEEPRFCWHDGPMLKAIKESSWILLDEMNLASQSVLEGLNACFDHRGEIYISELNKKFLVDKNTTRIFACQNPYNQGAARKGLPQSFINRFTSIYVKSHTDEDLHIILRKLYPNLPDHIIGKSIEFNNAVSALYKIQGYEFNLRDLIYWCELMTKHVNGTDFNQHDLYEPDRFVQFVYIDRMRSLADKANICDLFEKIFNYPVFEPPYRDIKMGEWSFMIARSCLKRNTRIAPQLAEFCILKCQMPYIESIAKALEFNRMPILVGESGVGKRSMVRIIAGLTGNKLRVIGANRDMDTVELLGSYEQKSLQREMVELIDEASKFTMSLINTVPKRLRCDSLKQLFKHVWSSLFATSIREHRISKNELMESYRFQLAQLDCLIEKLQPLSAQQTQAKFEELNGMIDNIKKKVLFKSESTYSSGNFEWIDSLLIKSVKEGSWLLIENANLMNPATLDRLNSLIEPQGTLSLNEKGSGENGIEILRPHPEFRLILTMNPEHGELSRAMRNRGVEIYVRTRFYFEDFLMLLNQVGFLIEDDTACMTYCIMQTSYDAHVEITGEKPENDGSLLAHFGLNFASVLAHQVRRGIAVDTVLTELLMSYYYQRGHLTDQMDEAIKKFIREKMTEYREKYVVDSRDDRYKWLNFRHDLKAMTGGDAIVSTLQHERKILKEFSCPIQTGLLKFDEMIDNFDIVNCCTAIKIFMELSSPGDFDYRRNCVKYEFSQIAKFVELFDSEVGSLQQECLPMISQALRSTGIIPPVDMHVDTRNSPDLHYTLLSLCYKDTLSREDLQNRWILSLYRINLLMITDQIEERSIEIANEVTNPMISLWALSEKVRTNQMLADDLIRPQAAIATDLYDLLNGLTRFVSNRCFPNNLVAKMMARLFWISYFSCKLKKAVTKDESIAICNQIPMLWALTYQKVIVPLIQDCELADLSFNNKKFSTRIQHICDFLDVNITKPSKIEKEYYHKVLNRYAATTKRCESVCREIDKFFNNLLGRYAVRSQAITFKQLQRDNNFDTGCDKLKESETLSGLLASNLIWSNSNYVSALYRTTCTLLEMENFEDDSPESFIQISEKLNMASQTLLRKRDEYDQHEKLLMEFVHYRDKCYNIHKRRCALDQFAPIWQAHFIQARLARIMTPTAESYNTRYNRDIIRRMLRDINGLVLSPRYFNTLNKFFTAKSKQELNLDESNVSMEESSLASRPEDHKNNFDMFATFCLNHILENIVLDNQVVGWTKMRVTTSDLSSSAPLIPEYSPILSLVSSYCLDITHLKLNSYKNSSPQLDSLLIYLWRAYAQIKFGTHKRSQDLDMARNLMHLRMQVEDHIQLVGEHQCKQKANCGCVEAYCRLRTSKYDETIEIIIDRADQEDRLLLTKALKMIYFGFYYMLEFAPIFTLDPSLRSREKMDVYKAELAHIKVDLHLRNILHYWKTGENLRLLDITPDEAKLYPFTIRILVERRTKLEKSLKSLRKEFTNRPKSDDGGLYYELRKEVEIAISRNTNNITSLINDLLNYLRLNKPQSRIDKLTHLNTKCRMFIKTLEKSIARFKSEFVLYSDLTTHYLAGLCFILQGMRLMYSRMEQKLQLDNMGFKNCLVDRFASDMMRLFSFSNFNISNMKSVDHKRALYPLLPAICPTDRVSYSQSLLLRSILIQLNQHIIITPSDIKLCIPIVRSVADRFHKAWLERKKFLEEQRKKHEDLYQYKTATTLGGQLSLDKQEFIDIVTKFPVYDHIYQEGKESLPHNDQANLDTEEKIINLNRSVDLSVCIDVCKAHYKFMKEASSSLLGQQSFSQGTEELRDIGMNQLIKLEAELFYTVIRKCIINFDEKFDASSLECHLLQANELIKILRRTEPEQTPMGSLRSSIEILDEEIFDIYHNPSPLEAIRFQELVSQIDDKIFSIQAQAKNYDVHPTLVSITKLTSRISSFLINQPLMKFVTGAHALLQQLEDWNKNVPREIRMNQEADKLIELIHSWRSIELKSWRSSLHRVKRKYIDDTLCDLWFRLYEAFNDPISALSRFFDEKGMQALGDIDMTSSKSWVFYQGFVWLIKDFFEGSTLGDYQIRLDLVFAFAIQTRFASLYEQSKVSTLQDKMKVEGKPSIDQIDYEKLTTYVYNIYRQYRGLMGPYAELLSKEENELSTALTNEIRIVNWQGRNLWDIKNNFRISHRKLNKVMNKYSEVLRRPLPNMNAQKNLSVKRLESATIQHSDRLEVLFDLIQERIQQVKIDTFDMSKLSSIKQAPTMAAKMVAFVEEVQESSKVRYIDVLAAIEDALECNSDSIGTFHSQRAQDLVIKSRDSKETKDEKLKTCRQIYHSKKFALQAVFKTLEELGASYRRGMNNENKLDQSILSLEPLRGMIQDQSHQVMRAASELVDDSLVISCNELYQEVLTKNQLLLVNPRREDLTGDQMDRIRGFAYDMVFDIIVHKKNAAAIYKHMMDIQASSMRFEQLRDTSNDKIVVYKFSKVHKSIKRFNELASRARLSISKLDMLLDCFKTYSSLQGLNEGTENTSIASDNSRERKILQDLIGEVNESNSLITIEQHEHIRNNLDEVKKGIASVSSELRNKLKHTITNHLYSDDDIDDIQKLYDDFLSVMDLLLPSGCDEQINVRPGTILGSIHRLRMEAEQKLKPIICRGYFAGHAEAIDISQHSNLPKMEIRLQKLLKQIKLASQELYKNELEFTSNKPTSESARRKLKPFNHVESSKLRDLLRAAQIAKQVSNCFITINIEDRAIDIKPVVTKIAPIMSIYTQNLSRYLNVILNLMHLKLIAANQLISFFTDLATGGFGLPCKLEDLEGGTEDKTDAQANEDNVGFGEGEGNTDASKKLEFESQLDELKKDDEQQNNEEEQQENDEAQADEHIDAHDDGVEMSDDFDAKTEGPEEGGNPEEEQDEDQNAEEEDQLNELDKEFDEVDQDEGNLDQNLWDDQDEPLGDDDEEDLREANLEQSIELETEAEPKLDDFDDNDEDDQNGQVDTQHKEDATGDENGDAREDSDVDMAEDLEMKEEPLEFDSDQEDETRDDQNMEVPSNELEDVNQDDESLPEDMDNTVAEEDKADDSAETADNQDASTAEAQDGAEMSSEQLTASCLEPISDNSDSDTCTENQSNKPEKTNAQSSGSKDTDQQGAQGGEAPDFGNDLESISDLELDEYDNDEKIGKRTIADRSTVELDQTTKRQRIEKAASEQEARNANNNAERVRHLEADKKDALVCIDLVSDSEDERLLDDKTDQQDQSGRPRDLRRKRDGGVINSDDEDEVQNEPDASLDTQHQQQQLQSTYNTNLGLLKFISHGMTGINDGNPQNEAGDQADLMHQIDSVLKQSNHNDEHGCIEADRLTNLWLECTKNNVHLIYELCQQLQIVLQPTKMSKYKGDYKSGKRLNMRKIISYIASQYRKDKIWLRRTKPCKRTYNISLAVDNSSSMSENNCRQMTYQSLALLAKSLSLIEAGSLNVVSFGEIVKCIHEFDQPYVDAIGAQWLRELRFDETRTSYTKLLEYSCKSFAKQAQTLLTNSDMNASVNQLLIIISDGRNVTSEEAEVKFQLKQLKSMGVLTLFLIIDDLKQNKGKSIMDVKICTKSTGTMQVENYMDMFPFPFYMLLRQMEAMPSILGDALRQWFELVSNGF